ncbi:MAG: site-specific DNA-methyltransferase [Candidatus Pacebacteria bacterium]|nr:site-specific DNA-methyltransferase [Candidatus Paceibacterota bacterium]MDD5356729.1 site-specific DNA-methyltransferase [Candidatus Paceibacterota bacterium]
MKKDNEQQKNGQTKSGSLYLSDNEKRDIVKFLEAGKPLPEKYRFLLFKDDREVELVWNGKTNEVTNVVLPFQVIEQIDEPREGKEFGDKGTLFDFSGKQITGWTNKLIWGDNKLILSSLKNGPMRKEIEAQGGLKLIYIDPPFDVGADFSMNISIGEENDSFTKKPSVIEEIAYRDTWGKGADSFIAMIYERLKLMHELLAEDGSIYVHCDWRVSAFMRMSLDEIFGKENFRNEIIWYYSTLGRPDDRFAQKHDTIFYYGKSNKTYFNEKGARVPYSDEYIKSHFRDKDDNGKVCRKRFDAGKWRTYYPEEGMIPNDVWEIPYENSMSKERLDYPTQKPSALLERIIKSSSNEGDLVADFFVGSGTTIATAEKLGRKWIGTDLGKFGIHTSRKRMVGIQRELKKAGKDFRAFEILNVGKYERESFLNTNDDLRAEEKAKQADRKEKEFIKLILSAYKAEPVESFAHVVGKKRDRLVAIGPINLPVSSKFIREIVSECKEKNLTKIDVLGFDYEMGMNFGEYADEGIDVAFKIIPREVFDKRAVERGQVNFYDVAYIDIKPIITGRGSMKELSIEITDFSVFYNQDNGAIDEELKAGRSKVIIENGQVLKVTKDKDTELVSREVLTKKWSDWIDYWAVDYNFADRKEIIKVIEDGEEKDVWTGDYIFDNEWQSFRTKKNRNLEFKSAPKELPKGDYKVAVKVVDIFGNDTTRVIDVKL